MCFRAIHDVKATDMGMSKVRFKAEVDFDGRVVTRSYLEKQDIEQLLQVCLKKKWFCNFQYLIFTFQFQVCRNQDFQVGEIYSTSSF